MISHEDGMGSIYFAVFLAGRRFRRKYRTRRGHAVAGPISPIIHHSSSVDARLH